MESKRGQVTLFIIIAIVVIAMAILAFILVPRIWPRERLPPTILDPEAYIGDCINQHLEPAVETLASQGGYLEQPELYIVYKENFVGYLCYVNIDNAPCINQQPFLKDFIEEQLEDEIRSDVGNCINGFVEAARKQNWDVSTCQTPKFSINLTEGRVNVPIICEITMSKGEDVRTFEELNPFLEWPLFEFVVLAREIVDDEITYSDFEQLSYMLEHPWVRIEKFRADGTEIYALEEKTSDKNFVFAIRNYVQSPGL